MSFFQSLLASSSPITVVSVESTDALTVSYNTPFFQVVFFLPITREVTLSDASVVTMNVTWQQGTYDENDPDTYSIEGILTLPSGVYNPGDAVKATVSVTVSAALTPDTLSNQIMWLRDENDNTSGQVDNWWNKYNRSMDMVKITDARRPNLNATGLDSNPTYEFTRANNDLLRAEATLGLSGDFTYYLLFQCADPTIAATSQFLIENTDNNTAFVNTGLQSLVRENEIWVDFRKNDAGDQQRIEFPFTGTDWHLLTVKHDSNGSNASTNVVKLDGALILKVIGADPVTHNSNTLKMGGNGFNTNNQFGGAFAELIMTGDYHDDLTEASVLDYFKTIYPTTLGGIEYFDETFFTPIDSVSEAWNGLDKILRSDGKYDFVAGTLTGKIYYLEQGATIEDWTSTLLVDTTVEIQSLKVYGRDSSDRLILLSAHKDSVTTNDNVGKLMIHRADTTADDGAYSSVDLVTSRPYPQDILIRDLDNDGVDEFLYTYQGVSAGQGGVRWFDCSDVDDVLDTGNWTEHTAITHESAWWMAGFFTIGGTERLIFSARTNRNSASVPGVYYLTPASPVTNTWTETTIDATSLDFNHVDVGNIFGNVNDIVVQNHDNDDIYAYDASSAWAKTTIITGGTSGVGTQLKIINNYTINGRSTFLIFVENDWAYLCYYTGSVWARRKLFQTLGHPADNEVIAVDVDDSGFLTIVFDDNTNLANANVRKFRL